MKIGILTYHHTLNYGATLQAYALYKTLEQLGHDVEIIDYRPRVAIKFYAKQLHPIWRSRYRFYFNQHFIQNIIKFWKMRQFLSSKMKLSSNTFYSKKELKIFNNQYNAVVCGSDELWNLNSFRGFDPSFFLDFINSKNTLKLSYAASFGNTESLMELRNYIYQLINDFDVISVRDSNSLRLVSECDRQAVKVLDPTFLAKYNDILVPPNIKKKYLLIYATDLSVKQENFVKSVANAKNLIPISIGYYNKVAHYNFIGVSPEEWLGYFSQAEYVVTSFYHGTIFSLIFRKPFTVFTKTYKAHKVQDLLNNLGLENRIFTDTDNAEFRKEYLFSNIYSDTFNDKLQKAIAASKSYLFEVLSNQSTLSV
ncbi:polysaccharide pyruvyl transferase family protein [Chlorogloeopsis sp. ULAP02]|uniref:polysaccharide pyruvyl transferase family protein n=1 Tax=Chlorogloeopsis sp. ULAP02 TaxID=3107926 RepID=UPI0031373FB0